MTLLPAHVVSVVGRALAAIKHDPISRIRLTPKQVEYVLAVCAHDESALRAANKFGKSTIAAVCVVALLRGLRSLAGIPLPRLKHPATAWCLTRTYKQQVQGTQAAVEFALGEWPHQIAWENRAEGIWSGVWIRPDGWHNDEPTTWAYLAFQSQQSSRNDADVAKGARLDLVWFDEPGYPSVVRELRKAGRPGWPFRIIHTFTPIRKAEWIDLRADIERPDSHIHEVVASIYDAGPDVENGFLTADEIATLERFYRGDPHRLARLRAIYCDVSGSNPFDTERLVQLLDEATPGEMYGVSVQHKDGKDLHLPVRHEQGGIEVWGWPEEDDIGIIVADPSSGVRDPEKSDAQQPRNPAGLILGSIKTRALLARFNGYVNPHELALMARALANRCPRWTLIHETNGGWGETFYRSFLDAAQGSEGSFWYERDPISGAYAKEPGWKQTHSRRGEILAATQRALSEEGLIIRSRQAIENLMQIRLDDTPNERWDQGEGRGPHGEDLITLGILCCALERGEPAVSGQSVKLASAATRAAPPRMPNLRSGNW